jgi:hypothetical protein
VPLGLARSAGLPPDWVGLERASGELVPLQLGSGDTTMYGYDAARAYWRVALDYRWNYDGRATAYLNLAGFLRDEVAREGGVGAMYAHDGTALQRAPSVVGTAGAVAALRTLEPATAHALHAEHFVGGAGRSGPMVYWGDPADLYAQEWGWFSTAQYADALTDVWHAGPDPARE